MKEYQEHICKKCGELGLIPPSRWKKKNYICKKCFTEYMRNYIANYPGARESQRKRGNNYQKRLRRSILEHYSGHVPAQCIQCGESRYSCLELDHINDDGAIHAKELDGKVKSGIEEYRAYRGRNSYIYRDIKKRNYPEGFQTLCANCHRVKTYSKFHEEY